MVPGEMLRILALAALCSSGASDLESNSKFSEPSLSLLKPVPYSILNANATNSSNSSDSNASTSYYYNYYYSSGNSSNSSDSNASTSYYYNYNYNYYYYSSGNSSNATNATNSSYYYYYYYYYYGDEPTGSPTIPPPTMAPTISHVPTPAPTECLPGSVKFFACGDGSTQLTLDCDGHVNVTSAAQLACAIQELGASSHLDLEIEVQDELVLTETVSVPSSASVVLQGSGRTSGGSRRRRLSNASHPLLLGLPEAYQDLALVLAPGAKRLFELSDGAHLSLKDLVLVGGSSPSYGGMVYSLGGNLKVRNCAFLGGRAGSPTSTTRVGGGAIFSGYYDRQAYVTAPSKSFALSIADSYFANNSAESAATSANFAPVGGALHVSAKCSSIQGCASQSITVEIRNTTFAGNNATSYSYSSYASGGGIYAESQDAGYLEVLLDGATLTENEAALGGAVGTGFGAAVTLVDSDMSYNVAVASTPGGGGAVSVGDRATVTGSNVTGYGNTASGGGGGGFVFVDEGGALVLTGCTITWNSAWAGWSWKGVGGAVAARKASVDLLQSTLESNDAEVGLAVMATNSRVFIFQSYLASPLPWDLYYPLAYLVQGYLGSHLVVDNSAVLPAWGMSAIGADGTVVPRNSEINGTIDLFTLTSALTVSTMTADDAKVATCSDLADEADLRCAADYCTDAAAGIQCYCPTVFGLQDPAIDGCDDPPKVHVFQERFDRYVDKPSALRQTFFFTNKGEEDLSWSVAARDFRYIAGGITASPPVSPRLTPAAGNLSSCEIGNFTVEVPALLLHSFQDLHLDLDLVSSSYPFEISADFLVYTPINTTVDLDLSFYVRAALSANYSYVMASNVSTAPAHRLDATAGRVFHAYVKPKDVADMWIRGSPGDQKFAALIHRAGDPDKDRTICEVGFAQDSDLYAIECALPKYPAGDFEISVGLVSDDGGDPVPVSAVQRGYVPVRVGCPNPLIPVSPRHGTEELTCGCPIGETLDVLRGKCSPCPTGYFGSDNTTIYRPDLCGPCARLIPGSVTDDEVGGLDACVCSPAFYKQWSREAGFDGVKLNLTQAIEDQLPVAQCKACPDGARCRGFGTDLDTLALRPGFWRTSLQSKYVLACPNPDACVGGNATMDICISGAEGPFCASCMANYYSALNGTCEKCSGAHPMLYVFVALVFFGMFVAPAVYVLLGVTKKVRIAPETATAAKNQPSNPARQGERAGNVAMLGQLGRSFSIRDDTARDVADAMLAAKALDWTAANEILQKTRKTVKIILNEIQLSASLQTSLFRNLPSVQTTIVGLFSIFTMDIARLTPLECILGNGNYHTAALLNTISPMCLLAFLIAVIELAESYPMLAEAAKRGTKLLMLYSYFIYVNMVAIVFNLFACEELDDGTLLLRVDYSIDCRSQRHKLMEIYGACMMVIFPIGIPLFYFVMLHPHDHKLSCAYYHEEAAKEGTVLDRDEALSRRDNDPELQHIRFLFYQYRGGMHYFEVAECGRKLLLSGIICFIAAGSPVQVVAAMALFVVCYAIMSYYHPYASQRDTRVAILSQVTTVCAVLVGLVFLMEDDPSVTDPAVMTLLIVVATIIPLMLGTFITFDDLRLAWEAAHENVKENIEMEKKKQRESKQLSAASFARVAPASTVVEEKDEGKDEAVARTGEEEKQPDPMPQSNGEHNESSPLPLLPPVRERGGGPRAIGEAKQDGDGDPGLNPPPAAAAAVAEEESAF